MPLSEENIEFSDEQREILLRNISHLSENDTQAVQWLYEAHSDLFAMGGNLPKLSHYPRESRGQQQQRRTG